MIHKCRYGQRIALHLRDGLHNIVNHLDKLFGTVFTAGLVIVNGVGPVGGYIDLLERGCAGVNGLPVHVNNIAALLKIRLLGGLFHELNSVL